MNTRVLLRRLLADPWVQRAIILAVIVWAFWNGIWAGVARSDQIPYLERISQFTGFGDILSHSPSFNRTLATPGDEILYRPILNLLLGTFYYLFRYNFVAWQIASLCLHIAVVMGLHLLLLLGALKRTLLPLAITLLFATPYLASELVLWHHAVGYVLFCGLEVYAMVFLALYLQTGRGLFLAACGALGVVAEFTFEVGAIVNVLLAAALLARSFTPPLTIGSPAQSRRSTDRWSALLFVLAALLLPIASWIDLRARGLSLAPRLSAGDPWSTLMLAGEATFRQIGFWLSGWLAPTLYRVFPSDRAVALVSPAGLTGLTLLNLLALALLAAAAAAGFLRLRQGTLVWKREAQFALALCLLFLFSYSMMIAVGRTSARGLEYVHSNIYYSYIGDLTVCVAVALAAAVGRTGAASAAIDGEPDSSRTGRSSWVSQTLVAALIVLAITNALGVRAFTRQFRYDYAASRQRIVDRVLAWHARVGDGAQRYFVVVSTCPGNDVLPWLQGVRFADAMWPRWSADLNAALIPISPQSVDVIRCDD